MMWLLLRLFIGAKKPKIIIPGQEFAGKIEAVGKDVKLFKKGDKVFGSTSLVGANAQYICMQEDGPLAEIPSNMTYEDATCIPFGGNTALYFLRDKGNIKKGQKVLIYGASGGVGTAGVQIAKAFETEVTGVSSSVNFELVKSLGATNVIDYKKEDFTKREERYDIIFDAVGKTSKSTSKKALKPNGKFVSVKKGLAKERKEDLIFLRELVEAVKFKAVIDRRYPMAKIVEAHRYVDKGHKKGNVVITVVNNNKT